MTMHGPHLDGLVTNDLHEKVTRDKIHQKLGSQRRHAVASRDQKALVDERSDSGFLDALRDRSSRLPPYFMIISIGDETKRGLGGSKRFRRAESSPLRCANLSSLDGVPPS